MDKNISNEKKPLRLKVKTFVDLRRFTSKQLHKIVENFRAKNKAYEAKYKDMSALNYMKVVKRNELLSYRVRNSLVNLSDKQTQKNKNRILEARKEFINTSKEYKANLKNGKYTEKEQKKIKNTFEDIAYEINKEMYARNLGKENQERPQNPKIERAINNVKNAAKTVGKGIATGATMVAGAVAFPFVMAYKGARAVGRKALAIGRGGKVAAITAGKVVGNTAKSVAENVKNQVGPIAQEVKETENAKRDMKVAEKSKELNDTATISAKREIYDNSSEQTQNAIVRNDWKAALREDKKFYAKQQIKDEGKNSEANNKDLGYIQLEDTIQEKRDEFDRSSEGHKEYTIEKDWKAALRENKIHEFRKAVDNINQRNKKIEDPEKQTREAQRRENLHMDKEEQTINHKEAIEKVEGEVLTEEEVKKVYGDQEK